LEIRNWSMSATSKWLGSLGALAAVLFAAAWFRHQQTASSPDRSVAEIGPLRNALEKTAAERLAAPSMAAATYRLTARAEKFDGEVTRVLALAQELGGAAVQESKDGTMRLLAQIPAQNVGEFC